VLRTAPVLALLDGQKPILPTEFTQAVPDMGQARLPLSPTLPDPRAKIPGARELPPCTVVVVGANGRVGSRVVTELLRKHSKVNVRALVRSASPNPDPNPNPHPNPNPNPNPNPHPNHYPNPNPNPSPKPNPKPKPNPSPSPNPNPNQVRSASRIQSYERLSYESGAEDGKMSIRPAWEIQEGGFAQGQTIEFDPVVQGSYGLDRLEILECDVRHRPDVARVIAGADAVIFCATSFGEGRTKLTERLESFNEGAAALGANLFELRLPGFGRGGDGAADEEAAARRKSAAGTTADEEGVALVLEELSRELARRARLKALTAPAPAKAKARPPQEAAAAVAPPADPRIAQLEGTLRELEAAGVDAATLEPLREELATLRAAVEPDATNGGETAAVKGNEDGLPDGWFKAEDPQSGRAYYYNKATRETSWTPPKPSPPLRPQPTPFVLLSGSAGLGYDDTAGLLGSDGSLQENEFGYRKRMGEAKVRTSGLEAVIVRAAILDQLRLEEGLQVLSQPGVVAEELAAGGAAGGAAGVQNEQLRKNRIHPRDVARVLVGCLFGVEGGVSAGGGEAPPPCTHTYEVWTEEFGKASPTTTLGSFFTTDAEAERQKWRDEGREDDGGEVDDREVQLRKE